MLKRLVYYKRYLKLAISFVMLLLIVRFIKFDKLEQVLLGVPWWVVCVVVCGYTFGPFLNCFRWWLLSRYGNVGASYPSALRAYFIGMFVNCFGFGTVGGDVARGLLLAGDRPVKAQALASVVADRAHGMAMLAMIGSISAILFGRGSMDPWLLTILSSIGPLVVLGWFLGPPLLLRLTPQSSHLHAKVEAVSKVFPKDFKVLFLISVISFVFHLLQIGLHAFMAIGVGASIPWKSLLVVIPFVNLVSTLPISWNGLGVRENAYVFFLAPAYLSTEQALAFGALWLLAVTTASAVGGLISVLTKESKSIEQLAEESESLPAQVKL